MSIITDEFNNININTNHKQGRLNFGIEKEASFLDLLYQNDLIDFEGNNNDSDDIFNWCDFKFSNDNVNIFLELKNRTNKIDRYPTTIFAKNKVQAYLNHKEPDKKNYYFIIFGYLNNNKQTEYYYIQYTGTFFKQFKNKEVFNKSHYEIPVILLKPIDSLFQILKNLSKNI